MGAVLICLAFIGLAFILFDNWVQDQKQGFGYYQSVYYGQKEELPAADPTEQLPPAQDWRIVTKEDRKTILKRLESKKGVIFEVEN
jgi:hypothetical protein